MKDALLPIGHFSQLWKQFEVFKTTSLIDSVPEHLYKWITSQTNESYW